MSDQKTSDLDSFIWDESLGSYVRTDKEGNTIRVRNPWIKCTCGVAKLGYDVGHSDWCDRYQTERQD